MSAPTLATRASLWELFIKLSQPLMSAIITLANFSLVKHGYIVPQSPRVFFYPPRTMFQSIAKAFSYFGTSCPNELGTSYQSGNGN